MILKILTRHNPSYASLIRYIIAGSKGKDGKPHVLTHNLRSYSEAGYVQEFIENEAGRKHPRKGQVYLYHEIISLSANEDKAAITDAMLDDLARKYISLRGATGMFISSVHYDKGHIHIHVCSSGTAFRTGKAFRLSHTELRNLKISFQNYHQEKYPELTKSSVRHGHHREYVTDKKWQIQHRNERKSAKVQIQAIATECFERATSQKEFLESLQDNGFHYYERSGVPAGIIHNEMKIRFSRLNISFDRLCPDRTEEEKALCEIHSLRSRQRDRRKELSKDESNRNI